MYSKKSIEFGLNWYETINSQCQDIADYYNLPLYKVCGIVSALSPRNKFKRNMEDTIAVIKFGINAKVATFGHNRRKAVAILEANSYSEVYAMFKGLKTRNFFTNLYKVHDDAVTVDVWMIRAYKEHITTKSLTDKGYRMIEKMIQDEARELNIFPNQLQAIKWCEIRGEAS